jgi:hypothetical protein
MLQHAKRSDRQTSNKHWVLQTCPLQAKHSPCCLATATHAALASHQHQLTELRQIHAAGVVAGRAEWEAPCYSLRKAAQLLRY